MKQTHMIFEDGLVSHMKEILAVKQVVHGYMSWLILYADLLH